MNLKMNESTEKLLYVLLGIVLVLCAGFLGFKNLSEKNTQLETEKTQLETEITRLNEIQAKEQMYLDDTKEYRVNTEKYYEQFPAYVQERDQLLYVTQMESRYKSLEVTKVDMDEAVEIIPESTTASAADTTTTSTGTTNTDTANTNTANTNTTNTNTTNTDTANTQQQTVIITKKLYAVPTKISCLVGYEDLKSWLISVSQDLSRKSLSQIVLTMDTNTNKLVGTIEMNQYFMLGIGNEYNPQDIKDVRTGKGNIFRKNSNSSSTGEQTED